VGKEFCEVVCQGRIARMEDFRRVMFVHGRRCRERRYNGSKGHTEEVQEFLAALRAGGPLPIPYEQLRAVTLATFAIEEALRRGTWVDVETLSSTPTHAPGS
jgi:hypothetical protein